jgi:hypothetical protein
MVIHGTLISFIMIYLIVSNQILWRREKRPSFVCLQQKCFSSLQLHGNSEKMLDFVYLTLYFACFKLSIVLKPSNTVEKGSSSTNTTKASVPSSSVPYIPRPGTVTKNVDSYASIPPVYRRKPLSQTEQDLVSVCMPFPPLSHQQIPKNSYNKQICKCFLSLRGQSTLVCNEYKSKHRKEEKTKIAVTDHSSFSFRSSRKSWEEQLHMKPNQRERSEMGHAKNTSIPLRF